MLFNSACSSPETVLTVPLAKKADVEFTVMCHQIKVKLILLIQYCQWSIQMQLIPFSALSSWLQFQQHERDLAGGLDRTQRSLRFCNFAARFHSIMQRLYVAFKLHSKQYLWKCCASSWFQTKTACYGPVFSVTWWSSLVKTYFKLWLSAQQSLIVH